MGEKHIICVCNQKGGVAKTTTVHELAYLFGKKYKTLAIDLDCQLTLSIYADKNSVMEKEEVNDIHGLMSLVKKNKLNLEYKEKLKTDVKNYIYNMGEFDIIFGSKLLEKALVDFGDFDDCYILQDIFESLDYDIIITDMHPDRGTITQMTYCAATDFIIPADSDRGSAEGVKEMAIDIKRYKEKNMSKGDVLGILQTKCDMRSTVWKEARERLVAIGDYFEMPIFDTYIRMANANAMRCKEVGQCMNEYNHKNNVSEDYRNLVKEIIKNWKKQKRKGSE